MSEDQNATPRTTEKLPKPYPKDYYGLRSPRCFLCNSIVYISNCTCSQCGQINILPEDIEIHGA